MTDGAGGEGGSSAQLCLTLLWAEAAAPEVTLGSGSAESMSLQNRDHFPALRRGIELLHKVKCGNHGILKSWNTDILK